MGVTIDKESMVELATLVAQSVVEALEKKNIIGNTINTINNNVVGASANAKTEKTAYQKTEQLLYNYRGFQNIIAERQEQIAEIKQYGVPQSSNPFSERVQGGTLPGGIVLPEESVEQAVQRIHCATELEPELKYGIISIDSCENGKVLLLLQGLQVIFP